MKKPSIKSPRVLVAENVSSVAALMRTLLVRRGYQVEVVGDGEQCLAKAASLSPSLILLDLLLPKVHGMEVLRRLKADPLTRGAGVILCTAKQYKADRDEARELGVFDVLTKPFERKDFIRVIERFFSGAARPEETRAVATVGRPYLPQIGLDRCYFRLWGTRGSIPVSGQRYVRHGGNTSCLEVSGGQEGVIVDAGSGIRELGRKLAGRPPCRLHILITHTHWDHIQGFPFFAPAYLPGFELVIYGASGFKKDLRSVFCGQLDRDYFPVQFEDMRAKIEFRTLEGESMEIGGTRVSWEFTHHPSATVGFKFEIHGKTLAYVSDNEFLFGYLGAPQDLTRESKVLAPHLRLVKFLRGVDVLIGEAQYTNQEYQNKVGWGHSSLSNACLLARLAKVKRWIVTHHDPLHEDDFLDHKLNLTKEILRSLKYPVEVVHGYDGLVEYL